MPSCEDLCLYQDRETSKSPATSTPGTAFHSRIINDKTFSVIIINKINLQFFNFFLNVFAENDLYTITFKYIVFFSRGFFKGKTILNSPAAKPGSENSQSV